MAAIEPGKGRAVIEDDGSGLRITISAEVQLRNIAFMSLWLTIWVIGEATITGKLLGGQPVDDFSGGGPLAPYFFLLFWTFAGAWMISALLWQVIGREIIELRPNLLRQRKQIMLISFCRDFAVSHIANLRLAPPQQKSTHDGLVLSHLSFETGAILFDYGRATRHLGQALDETQAKHVIEVMSRRLSSLCAKAANGTDLADVGLGKGRAVIENDGTGLRITIPARAQPAVIVSGGLWLSVWAYVAFLFPYLFFYASTVDERSTYEYVFMTIFLALWTYGGIRAIAEFLWAIAGKEIIELGSNRLTRIKQIPIFSRSRAYDVAEMNNLRFAPSPAASSHWEREFSSLSLSDGTITFDYGRSIGYLASGLDEADARYVIAAIRRRARWLAAGSETVVNHG